MKHYLKRIHGHTLIHNPKHLHHRALIIWCAVFFSVTFVIILVNF